MPWEVVPDRFGIKHIGLHREHQRFGTAFLRLGEGVLNPGDVGAVALHELGHCAGVPHLEVVVAAHDMQRGEQHVLVLPAQVFDELGMRRVLRGLALHGQGCLAQRLARWEEHAAQSRQPLQGIEGPVVGAVAVGPLVVARGEDQRSLKQSEVLELGLELFVRATGRARLEVADVDGKSRLQPVDAANQRAVRRAHLGRVAIGQVAEGYKLKGLGLCGQRGGGQGQANTTAEVKRQTGGRKVHGKPRGG